MTPATVIGIACAEHDAAATYRYGRLRTAESFDKLIPDLPTDGVPLDVAHDGQSIGSMIHGELDTAGRLGVVCVVEDGDWLLDYPAPVFYSPELLVAGPGVRTRAVAIADAAALAGLALTTNPGTIAAQPVAILAGDIRNSTDRGDWPISWATEHPLAGRCVNALPEVGARHHRARRIDRRQELTRLDCGIVIDQDGEPVAIADRSAGRLTADGGWVGELWHRPSRIVSVGGTPVHR